MSNWWWITFTSEHIPKNLSLNRMLRAAIYSSILSQQLDEENNFSLKQVLFTWWLLEGISEDRLVTYSTVLLTSAGYRGCFLCSIITAAGCEMITTNQLWIVVGDANDVKLTGITMGGSFSSRWERKEKRRIDYLSQFKWVLWWHDQTRDESKTMNDSSARKDAG